MSRAFNRVFTFGCSFTNWMWPTWADILMYDQGVEGQNWGINGAGNVCIFYRMIECDIKNKFTPDDLIVTLWSSWSREDRYLEHGWTNSGSIFHSYDRNFIEKYWNMKNDIIKNSSSIISANKMFDIKVNGHMIPIDSFEDSKNLDFSVDNNNPDNKEYIALYQPHIPSDGIFPRAEFREIQQLVNDNHPDILHHLEYLENTVYPKLNSKIKKSTKEYYSDMHNSLVNFLKKYKEKKSGYTINQWDTDQWKMVNQFLKEHYNYDIVRLGM